MKNRDDLEDFIAKDIVSITCSTVTELTKRIVKLGGDVSDMTYMNEEWQSKISQKY